MMTEKQFILDTMQWSFSRLNIHCLYEFYLKYFMCMEGRGSFFAQVGTFMHEILEKYAAGQLSVFELSQYFEDNFDANITEPAPYCKTKDMRQSYYEECLEYLNNIPVDFYNKYNIIEIEKEVHTKIPTKHGDMNLIGYIDLLVEDKETNELIILDYKSTVLKWKKKNPNEPLKSYASHWLEFQRQLYLYSKAVMEEFNRPVNKIGWIMFRANEIRIIEWCQEDYDAAIKWASDTINSLYDTQDWEVPNIDGFYYCNNLCSMRDECKYLADKKLECTFRIEDGGMP